MVTSLSKSWPSRIEFYGHLQITTGKNILKILGQINSENQILHRYLNKFHGKKFNYPFPKELEFHFLENGKFQKRKSLEIYSSHVASSLFKFSDSLCNIKIPKLYTTYITNFERKE